MPRGDRTGPMGAGPMTGRGAGYCAGYSVLGYSNLSFGRGFGGGGRGWRHGFYATGLPGWMRFGPAVPPFEQGTDMLKKQADWLKDQLEAINQRIAEIEKENQK